MTPLEQLRRGHFAGAQRLKLACGLSEFPREIFDLADTLEILDLSGNALSSLPDDLPRLHRLRVLFCSDNPFTELPAVLGQCPHLSMVAFKANRIRTVPAAALAPQLRWLILTDNRIEALPPEIGRCTRMQKLMLAGNRLSTLPAEMAACTRLELLRLSANQLTELPAWLLTLPRLTWLAYAGNPLSAAWEAQALSSAPIAPIDWSALTLQAQLGEGASGVIHRAALHEGATATQTVAVKLFKGAVTSDGWPDSEMAACIAAGAHPNLIPVLARLQGHPDGVHGLVLKLIAPQWRNLAGPPSLDSCTRDVYDAQARFDLAAVLGIAGDIAAAAWHLHQRGITHGDLYAHNILHDEQGHALLGDFGAAAFYPRTEPGLAQALEHLEVRAWGCLLEELLERCAPQPRTLNALATLQALKDRCMSERIGARPRFAEIVAILSAVPR